ncbi:MAG: hypothetical protein ABIH04_00565 [Planctomycetota bacterium]
MERPTRALQRSRQTAPLSSAVAAVPKIKYEYETGLRTNSCLLADSRGGSKSLKRIRHNSAVMPKDTPERFNSINDINVCLSVQPYRFMCKCFSMLSRGITREKNDGGGGNAVSPPSP